MQIVTVPSSTTYSNLNTLASISVSKSFVITNHTSGLVSIIVSPTQPADDARGVPLYSTQTFYVEESDTIVWIKGTTGKVVIQDTAEIVSPYSTTNLPRDVWTSSEEGFRRLRVDVGQTGLYEGREFRMVRKVSIPAATPLVFKFTSAVDFILFEQSIDCSEGDIEYYAWRSTQGTAGGTFTPLAVPPIGKNTSSFYRQYSGLRYASQVTLETGGTFTPTDANVYVDYDRAKTSGATAQQTSVSGGDDSVRYLAAGTYYLKLTSLNGTSVGRFALAWEERLTS